MKPIFLLLLLITAGVASAQPPPKFYGPSFEKIEKKYELKRQAAINQHAEQEQIALLLQVAKEQLQEHLKQQVQKEVAPGEGSCKYEEEKKGGDL